MNSDERIERKQALAERLPRGTRVTYNGRVGWIARQTVSLVIRQGACVWVDRVKVRWAPPIPPRGKPHAWIDAGKVAVDHG